MNDHFHRIYGMIVAGLLLLPTYRKQQRVFKGGNNKFGASALKRSIDRAKRGKEQKERKKKKRHVFTQEREENGIKSGFINRLFR